MNYHSQLRKITASLFFLILLTSLWLTGAVMAQAKPAQVPLANQNVFLPLITNGEAGRPPASSTATATTQPNQPTSTVTAQLNQPTPTATATTPNQPAPTATATDAPPAEPTSVGLFLESQWRTSSASLKVDKNGGMHAGYYYDEARHDNAPNWAVYAYCATNCAQSDQWQRVNLAQDRDVLEVQLSLTKAGQPRLLIRATSTVYSDGKDYLYAACDQNCTDASNWQVGYVATTAGTEITDVNDNDTPQHFFTLDPQDHPRFVFQDRNYAHAEPDLYGGYYATCDTDCTSGTPDNPTWSRTKITNAYPELYQDEILNFPSLTFTSQGAPRVVGQLYPTNKSGDLSGIYYFGCDSNCDQHENWQRVYLADRGNGTNPSWDLELDSQDRPRIAFYKGEGQGESEKLLYLWCNENCLDQATTGDHWSYNVPGVPTLNGKHPDLELDSQDRPHIAYADTSADGLGYVWCSANCETDNPTYQHKVIESAERLQADWPVAIPFSCDGGLWHGINPILALDGQDKPHVAYDTTYDAHCLYDDPSDGQPPFSAFHQIIRAVRVTVFDLP